jgi:hypothetical protein
MQEIQTLQRANATTSEQRRRDRATMEGSNDGNANEPPTKRSRDDSDNGAYRAGKKFVALYCMYATRQEIFGDQDRNSDENEEIEVDEEVAPTTATRQSPAGASTDPNMRPLQLFADEEESTIYVQRNEEPPSSEQAASASPSTTPQGQTEPAQANAPDGPPEPFLTLMPNDFKLDIRKVEERQAFIKAKVALFRREASADELQDWGSQKYMTEVLFSLASWA